MDTRRLRVVPHAIQQDGFADSSKPYHEYTFAGEEAARPLDGNADRFAKFVTTGKLRWLSSCAWGERILYWIHGQIIDSLVKLSFMHKFTQNAYVHS